MSKAIVNPERVSEAKRDVIVCFAWLALAPLALWFGVANLHNLWLSVVPIVFACTAVAPLLFSYAIVGEYKDARKGVWSAI